MWDWLKHRSRTLRRIERKVDWLMASFQDLATAQADTAAKVAAIKTDVEDLLTKLKNVPPAGMTPEQQAALDAAVTAATAINDSLAAVDAEAKAPPA